MGRSNPPFTQRNRAIPIDPVVTHLSNLPLCPPGGRYCLQTSCLFSRSDLDL